MTTGTIGNRNLRQDVEDMLKNGYQGLFSQEITDGGYYEDPFFYDKRNMYNLKHYFGE